MKLHEVLHEPEVVTGNCWFRPVGWPNGFAYCIKDGNCYGVPSSKGGSLGITACAESLSGEWESVTPDEVLNKENTK